MSYHTLLMRTADGLSATTKPTDELVRFKRNAERRLGKQRRLTHEQGRFVFSVV